MKAKKVKGLDPRTSLLENAGLILRARLGELRSFLPAALEPEAVDDQHEMRIAAKRLRYVLETTGFCFGPPAEAARDRARDLQEALGELHDCDVMSPRVENHLGELRSADAAAVRARADGAVDLDPALTARAANRTAYRGLGLLAVHLEARRRLHFDRFVELWAEIERERVFEQLESAIDRALD